jgi:hypothetical protein
MIAIQIFYVVFFLYMWFDTDAFVEYSKLLGLGKLLKISNWEEYREINPRLDYLEYLRLKHSSFFIRLVSCKQCLCFWISLSSFLFFTCIFLFPVVYMLSYLIYSLICKLVKY